MYRFVCNQRYVKLLFSIRENKNIHQLSRESNMTTSHLSNVMDQFKREGIIEKEKKGREVEITLTEKGIELLEILRQYDNLNLKEALEKDKEAKEEENGKN